MDIIINQDYSMGRIRESDKASLVQYLNDADIYRNTLQLPHPYRQEDADWFVSHTTLMERTEHRQKFWAIRNSRQTLIGGIGMHFKYGKNAHKDEIGYWLAKPYRNQGIMTTAIRTLCDHAFEHLGKYRLEATIFHFNKSSARVLEKAGFEREGVLRKYHFKDGELIDGILYARVKE
jgi:[ribosomal protein S5]-alanine N-acetyltransferase